jgi:hypothetical protein
VNGEAEPDSGFVTVVSAACTYFGKGHDQIKFRECLLAFDPEYVRFPLLCENIKIKIHKKRPFYVGVKVGLSH